MELEAIRMVAAAAADPTIGINAMLAALTLDGTDVRPANVTIYNSVDDAWVARRTVPESGGGITFPAVAILVNQPITLGEVHTVVRDGDFAIAIAVVQKNSDSAAGNRDALYVGHAVLRFLKLFAANENAAMRVRGGIQIITPKDTKQPPIYEPWGAAFVAGATVTTWLVRDTAA